MDDLDPIQPTTSIPLADISTRWSLIFAANRDSVAAADAHRELMQRYFGSVYRYLLAAARDPHIADDLAQEFALRFLRGGFRRADPVKGRFRDYVKTSLQHLLADHFRQQRSAVTHPLLEIEDGPSDPVQLEMDFQQRWRDELLEWTWHELFQWERTHGTPYHTLLRWKAAEPQVSAAELAERLSRTSGNSYNDVSVRQILHRARRQFADLLLTEVARSLEGDDGQLEAELADLGLLSYCKHSLADWTARKRK